MFLSSLIKSDALRLLTSNSVGSIAIHGSQGRWSAVVVGTTVAENGDVAAMVVVVGARYVLKKSRAQTSPREQRDTLLEWSLGIGA